MSLKAFFIIGILPLLVACSQYSQAEQARIDAMWEEIRK